MLRSAHAGIAADQPDADHPDQSSPLRGGVRPPQRQLLQSLNNADSVQALAEQEERDTVAILTEAAAP